MARQNIGIGVAPNDGTGDPLRTAMTKVNDMSSESFQLSAAGREIYLDLSFVPASGSTSTGSRNSPFVTLADAVTALNVTGTGGVIIASPGNYSHPPIVLPRGTSMSTSAGPNQVTFLNSLRMTNALAEFKNITFGGAAGTNTILVGTLGSANTETIQFINSIIAQTTLFDGGSTGNDTFLFSETQFLGFAARNMSFRGGEFIITRCSFQSNINIFFGTEQSSACPRTTVTVVGSEINSTITIRARVTTPLVVNMFTTSMANAMLFSIEAGASVIINMDSFTYNAALVAGTDFNVADVSINIIGSTRERLLLAVSTVDQNPTGLDAPLQLTAGAAQGSALTPVELTAAGLVIFHQNLNTFERLRITIGRTGGIGVSRLYLRAVINGTPNPPIFYELDDADDQRTVEFSLEGNRVAGDQVYFEMIRDSSNGGNDSGGILTAPAPAHVDWADAAPSIVYTIDRRA